MNTPLTLAALTTCLMPLVLQPSTPAQAAPLCFDQPATIVATGGYVPGTEGPDVIVITGGRGAEVHSFGGRDRICGATVAHGGRHADMIALRYDGSGQGEIEIGGGPGPDRIVISGEGRTFGDVLGGYGDDRITTGPGSQTIAGGPGDDYIRAGAGEDWAYGQGGYDFTGGGPGPDSCDGEVQRNCES